MKNVGRDDGRAVEDGGSGGVMSVGESDSDPPGLLEYFEWERIKELFVLIGKGLLSVVVHKRLLVWIGSVTGVDFRWVCGIIPA